MKRPTLPEAITGCLKPSPLTLVKNVEDAAQELADAMRAIHGGDWRVQIDHGVEFVMVRSFTRSAVKRS